MVRQKQPFNAETPLNLLQRGFVTPGELFYVRNHGSLPAVDPATYRFTVSGLVERPLELSLEQLKSERLRVEMVATLCCAGNRRRELAEVRDAGEDLLGRWRPPTGPVLPCAKSSTRRGSEEVRQSPARVPITEFRFRSRKARASMCSWPTR